MTSHDSETDTDDMTYIKRTQVIKSGITVRDRNQHLTSTDGHGAAHTLDGHHFGKYKLDYFT